MLDALAVQDAVLNPAKGKIPQGAQKADRRGCNRPKRAAGVNPLAAQTVPAGPVHGQP